MSQASNKVDWCLKKVEKEIEETGIHRGLIKIEPDINMAEKHIIKAEHNLNAALFFDKGDYSDWSASAFFYCIYHCFLAIARKFGYESRNQECTLALIELLREEGKIDIDDKFIDTLKITKAEEMHESNVIKIREDFQYGVKLEFKERREFSELENMCKEIINKTKEIVHVK